MGQAATARRLWGNPAVGLLFRLVLAGILGFAGLTKLVEPNGAREAIIAYRIPGMTGQVAGVLGWALPAGEVLLAVLLLIGLFTRWAALATAALMAAFIVGIASVWARGYSIDCGCFGGGGDVSPEGKAWRYSSEILRDLLFAGMAVWLSVWPRTLFALDRTPAGRAAEGSAETDERHHESEHESDHEIDDEIDHEPDGLVPTTTPGEAQS